jgi:hypothetical protein
LVLELEVEAQAWAASRVHEVPGPGRPSRVLELPWCTAEEGLGPGPVARGLIGGAVPRCLESAVGQGPGPVASNARRRACVDVECRVKWAGPDHELELGGPRRKPMCELVGRRT